MLFRIPFWVEDLPEVENSDAPFLGYIRTCHHALATPCPLPTADCRIASFPDVRPASSRMVISWRKYTIVPALMLAAASRFADPQIREFELLITDTLIRNYLSR